MQMEAIMPGYELIDHDERNAVLDVFDSDGGVLLLMALISAKW